MAIVRNHRRNPRRHSDGFQAVIRLKTERLQLRPRRQCHRFVTAVRVKSRRKEFRRQNPQHGESRRRQPGTVPQLEGSGVQALINRPRPEGRHKKRCENSEPPGVARGCRGGQTFNGARHLRRETHEPRQPIEPQRHAPQRRHRHSKPVEHALPGAARGNEAERRQRAKGGHRHVKEVFGL